MPMQNQVDCQVVCRACWTPDDPQQLRENGKVGVTNQRNELQREHGTRVDGEKICSMKGLHFVEMLRRL